VVRRAYADWSFFDEDRRMMTRSHVEPDEMPQRLGASRKNAATSKMAVDAMELAFRARYVSTFAICTGDSDFTPWSTSCASSTSASSVSGREVHVGRCRRVRRVPLLRPPGGSRGAHGTGPARPPGDRPGRSRTPSSWNPKPAGGQEPARDVNTLAVLVAQTVPVCRAAQRCGHRVHRSTHPCSARTRPSPSPTTGFVPLASCCGTCRAQRGRAGRRPGKGDPKCPCPNTATGGRLRAAAAPWSAMSPQRPRVGASGLKNQLRRIRPDFAREARLPQLPAVLPGSRHNGPSNCTGARSRRLSAHRHTVTGGPRLPSRRSSLTTGYARFRRTFSGGTARSAVTDRDQPRQPLIVAEARWHRRSSRPEPPARSGRAESVHSHRPAHDCHACQPKEQGPALAPHLRVGARSSSARRRSSSSALATASSSRARSSRWRRPSTTHLPRRFGCVQRRGQPGPQRGLGSPTMSPVTGETGVDSSPP